MRSPSPNDLVFLTGGTGFIGMSTLIILLQQGYRVRAAVRTDAKAAELLAHPKITPLNNHGLLTTTVVPDITVPGAYNAAIDQATHVIHVASPLAAGADTVPPHQHHTHFIKPAVDGTINLLTAAERSGSVRRVVITSSFVALAPLSTFEGRTTPATPLTPSSRPPLADGPYDSEFAAYAASKVAALRAAEAWAARVRPGFDVVHLHPGFVIGQNPAAASAAQVLRGTNSAVLGLLLGFQRGEGQALAGATVHVEDVARAHVAALDPGVYGGESYILSGEVRWEDAVGFAKGAFPRAFEERVLMESGRQETLGLRMETGMSEVVFGWEFRGFEEQVRGVVGQFLELRAMARRNRGVRVGGRVEGVKKGGPRVSSRA